MPSNLGQNTSSARQAKVRINPEGCLTKELADLLQSNIIIEFPDSLREDGTVDVLSANALNQIATQLSSTAQFQKLIIDALTSEGDTFDSFVKALSESEDFIGALNGSKDEDADKFLLSGSTVVGISDQLQGRVPVSASGAYYFVYSLSSVTGDLSGSYVESEAVDAVTIRFPNAVQGNSATVNWVRILKSSPYV